MENKCKNPACNKTNPKNTDICKCGTILTERAREILREKFDQIEILKDKFAEIKEDAKKNECAACQKLNEANEQLALVNTELENLRTGATEPTSEPKITEDDVKNHELYQDLSNKITTQKKEITKLNEKLSGKNTVPGCVILILLITTVVFAIMYFKKPAYDASVSPTPSNNELEMIEALNREIMELNEKLDKANISSKPAPVDVDKLGQLEKEIASLRSQLKARDQNIATQQERIRVLQERLNRYE